MTDTYERGPNFSAKPGAGDRDDDEDDSGLLERFAKWNTQLGGQWSAWREDAELWYGFAGGDQWTSGERAEMEGAQKIPVTFNLIGPVVDAVQGAEIQNRQQVQFYPREAGDTGVSDVLTQGAEYVTEECNGDQEDTESFWDCLVCGMGWTETRPEIEGDQVNLVKERVDPLQMWADPAARKRCLEDMRYLKREHPMSPDAFDDFKDEIGREDVDGLEGGDDNGKRVTIVNPATRYSSGMLGTGDGADTVIVCEWQWWDREPVFLAGMPSPDGTIKIQQLDEEKLTAAKGLDPTLRYSQSHRKVYYRAFATDTEILFKEVLREGDFRYKAITGKRDRNTGTWYGLVKPMMDPQRFTNKLYSEILNIVRHNASGGMALEEDAVDDVRQFESSWASTDRITWLKPGSLSGAHGSKMIAKTPPPVQVALFQLMEFARDMVKATTGVNEEILGLVQREQAGVLEAQRKQAAYGILSAFFDSKRRYQRNQGRLLLAQMREYFPPDKLVRIVDQGTAQYVELATSMEAQQFDIVVDEAPSGPDQKAKILAVLMPLLPQLLEAGLIGPEAVAEIILYLPIPAAVANKLAAAITKKAQAPPDEQETQMGEAEIENKVADTAVKQADVKLKTAKAFGELTGAHSENMANMNPETAAAALQAMPVAPKAQPGPEGAGGAAPASAASPPPEGPQGGPPAPAPGPIPQPEAGPPGPPMQGPPQ